MGAHGRGRRMLWVALLSIAGCCGPEPAVDDSGSSLACDPGSIEDDGACVPEACGTGAWGDLPVDGETVRVDVSAPDGGDGSAGAPFNAIQPGLDAAGSRGGGLVAVAAGTYRESLDLNAAHSGVQLAGRCRDLVVLDGSQGEPDSPALYVHTVGGQLSIAGLTITDAPDYGLQVSSGQLQIEELLIRRSGSDGAVFHSGLTHDTEVEITGLEIVEATGRGLAVQNVRTSVTLHGGSILDTRSSAGGADGWGLVAVLGAELEAEGLEIVGSQQMGARIYDEGTRVDLRDSSVRDTQPTASGELGLGVHVGDQAQLIARRTVFSGHSMVGVVASDSGTIVELHDSSIEGVSPTASGDFGYGLAAHEGGSLTAAGCEITGNVVGVAAWEGGELELVDSTLQHNTGLGLSVQDEGTLITLRSSSILDTSVSPRGEWGYGAVVGYNGSLEATDSSIGRSTGIGLAIGLGGGSVSLDGCRIHDTATFADGFGGYGIQLESGAVLEAWDSVLEGNTNVALIVGGQGASASLEGCSVFSTMSDARGDGGFGAEVFDGGVLMATDCSIDDNIHLGIVVGTGAVLELIGGSITGTRQGTSYVVGMGLLAQQGATVHAEGLEISGNEGPGLLATNPETSLSCSRCELWNNQFAGAVVGGAEVTLDHSELLDNGELESLGGGVGLCLMPDDGGMPPALELEDSLIQGNPIAGIWIDGPGQYVIEGNDIAGGVGWSRCGQTFCGDAIFARGGTEPWDGHSGLLLQDNLLRDAHTAGLLLDGSSATLSGNSYRDNGVDLVRQGPGCEQAPEGFEEEALSSAELCPNYDYSTCGDNFSLVLDLAELEQALRRPPPPQVGTATLAPKLPAVSPLPSPVSAAAPN